MAIMNDNKYLIGDIRIDGITPSKEFLEFAEKEKRGEVTEEDIKRVFCNPHTVKAGDRNGTDR